MITTLQTWSIGLIQVLQQDLSWVGVMRFLSFLGQEEFYLLLMPAVYWCWDASLGRRLAVVLILANGTKEFLKLCFHQPRPFWVDRQISALSFETSYGIPSGHAMTATNIWYFLAVQVKKGWLWVFAILLVLAISFSRLYLGMHFIGDVLYGWLFGGMLLAGFLFLEKPCTEYLARLNFKQHIWLSLGVSGLVFLMFTGVLQFIRADPDPQSWRENAAYHLNIAVDDPELDPRSPEIGATIAGQVAGLGLAFAFLAKSRLAFDGKGAAQKRLLRFLIGFCGVLFFWMGLKLISPEDPLWLALSFRYVRYALTVFWAIYLAPWAFVRWRLA